MGDLRQRLNWTADGALHDGPRRYLMMRTDVLMGTLARLPAEAQAQWLQSWAASTQAHGAASLQAYAQMVHGDHAALTSATVQAAADLGWGRWNIAMADDMVQLQVQNSPFVHGWRAATAAHSQADAAVCAPIAGLFGALATLLLQAPVTVAENRCSATLADTSTPPVCSFTARRRATGTPAAAAA